MAAQNWTALQTTFLAATVKAQPPYTSPPPDFAALLPQATSYAEERIFTDIPLLGVRTNNSSLVTTAGNRDVSLSAMVNSLGGPIIIPEEFYLIIPAAATPKTGTRVPFIQATPALISTIWPIEAVTIAPTLTDYVPRLWALRNDNTIIYAPTADAAYVVDITGLYQPTPISSSNPTTYISTTYPALLEAACMVFLSGWLLHNFGAQGDLPAQAVSHETQYGQLMQSAKAEEMRRRGLAPNVPMPQTGAPAQ